MYFEVPIIKDSLESASSGRQMHSLLKGITGRKRNINGERKRKLGYNLEVLKEKKCIEVDIKKVTSADEYNIKKMAFCIQL